MNSFNRDMMTTDEKLDELHNQLLHVESVVADILIRVALMNRPKAPQPQLHLANGHETVMYPPPDPDEEYLGWCDSPQVKL